MAGATPASFPPAQEVQSENPATHLRTWRAERSEGGPFGVPFSLVTFSWARKRTWLDRLRRPKAPQAIHPPTKHSNAGNTPKKHQIPHKNTHLGNTSSTILHAQFTAPTPASSPKPDKTVIDVSPRSADSYTNRNPQLRGARPTVPEQEYGLASVISGSPG